MTTLKTVNAPENSDCVPVVVQTQPLDKTQELPALGPDAPEGEAEGASANAAPQEIMAGDVTVPIRCSIESTLTFEMLRRQSIPADDDDETR